MFSPDGWVRRTTARACPMTTSPTCSEKVSGTGGTLRWHAEVAADGLGWGVCAVLSGTKYALKQTRGKYGLGAKMVEDRVVGCSLCWGHFEGCIHLN